LNAYQNRPQTSLYVVRHGRTAFNVDERYLGALDPPLDELGLQQAADLAHLLQDRVDTIVCSPKIRAVQTAEILASSWHMPFTIMDAFAERNVGVYEGLTRDEARLAYPTLWQQDITRQWDMGPPGGESIKAVFERVAAGLTSLEDRFAGRNAVLIAHGFVAKVIRALLTDLSWDEFFRYALKNGQVEHYTGPLNSARHAASAFGLEAAIKQHANPDHDRHVGNIKDAGA
jgi:broad specificity phosphatase PhoE